MVLLWGCAETLIVTVRQVRDPRPVRPRGKWSGVLRRPVHDREVIVTAKPTVADLGIDLDAQAWQRSGDTDGAIEVAFVDDPAGAVGEWVLMRVVGDPAGRVLAYDRHEWECFIDGVKKGEFDDASYDEVRTRTGGLR